MDIISHGLYGGIAFGRKARISYWKAFFFGVVPDLASFGVLTAFSVLGLVSGPDWGSGPPDPNSIPRYVHHLYDATHSLVVAFSIFGIVWWVLKRPFVEMLAWPLHILVDMPTHSSAFFPTPFLWPFSSYTIDGISWSNPYIFFPNVIFLAVLYGVWFMRKRKGRLQV